MTDMWLTLLGIALIIIGGGTLLYLHRDKEEDTE